MEENWHSADEHTEVAVFTFSHLWNSAHRFSCCCKRVAGLKCNVWAGKEHCCVWHDVAGLRTRETSAGKIVDSFATFFCVRFKERGTSKFRSGDSGGWKCSRSHFLTPDSLIAMEVTEVDFFVNYVVHDPKVPMSRIRFDSIAVRCLRVFLLLPSC